MATLTAAELRNLGRDELLSKLGEAKEELFNLRFQAATGQLESHGRLRAVRKDIARIYTVLTERALGITDEVDAAPAAAEDAVPADEAETADETEKAGSKA
ncbi:large subunit ribosomal protein L29 [Kribbella antiqua]|jgi:large subunit ribosomal protein L29|uniref:Large ribosomal subunit protein uL29 n=1 Tax=Kribbella antiqua TaxID=2512217 RepID=A0A4R2IWE8_9ACTN|nr:50S ribosomal protein L29 [Kribbella antiqua]TCO49547.1 large subunit ribosomal protein L29 [Kribbella antiqua]